ncbi:MAG: hypothetical protein SA339_02225 [Methanomassiliicoccus sp.]|nr:hypothetical protein [Methanomassiliicoccus sp.]
MRACDPLSVYEVHPKTLEMVDGPHSCPRAMVPLCPRKTVGPFSRSAHERRRGLGRLG